METPENPAVKPAQPRGHGTRTRGSDRCRSATTDYCRRRGAVGSEFIAGTEAKSVWLEQRQSGFPWR